MAQLKREQQSKEEMTREDAAIREHENDLKVFFTHLLRLNFWE